VSSDEIDTTGLVTVLRQRSVFPPAMKTTAATAHRGDSPSVASHWTSTPPRAINEAAVFAKYGLNDKAINHLEEFVRKLPDNKEAREALAQMSTRPPANGDRATKVIQPVVDALKAAVRSRGRRRARESIRSVEGCGRRRR
jgi:hypothetical protein